jgi:hypothetical protein
LHSSPKFLLGQPKLFSQPSGILQCLNNLHAWNLSAFYLMYEIDRMDVIFCQESLRVIKKGANTRESLPYPAARRVPGPLQFLTI